MADVLLLNQPQIRLAAFAGVLLVLALAEAAAPRRPRQLGRWLRWSNNLAVAVLASALVRLIFPLAAVGIAAVAEQRGWGLFNWFALPAWLTIPFSIVLLDLFIYLQHVVFHAWAPLWRLHRMHHADLEIDVTTGLRFHPLEIVLSMGVKAAAIAALGAPAVAVLIFEVLLNATAMFNHANLRLPPRLDRRLRLILVTPDMHRVHHSVVRTETDSNFGFSLSWWDWLFGTYRAAPAAGYDGMTIGVPEFRERRDLWLDRLLLQPFRRSPADAPPAVRSPAARRP